MKKKILLIGGTGTISSPIAKLLAEDEDVSLYMLTRGRRGDSLGDGVIRITADISDTEHVSEILNDLSFDCVIDFILYRPEDAEKRYGIFKDKTKQYIFISTNVALNHDVTCSIDESLPLGNRYSHYGQAKSECERFFMGKYLEEDFPVTIVRPTQTYSEGRIPLSVKPGGYWPVISRILRDREVIVHGDGEGVWAGTHADDFAVNFMGLICNERALGEAVLIANPEPYTWNNLYRTIGMVLNREVRIVHIPTEMLAKDKTYSFDQSIRGDKYYSNLFCLDKLKELTGKAEFRVSMEDGVRGYIAWMDAHPELKKEDPDFDAWCDRVCERYHRLVEQFAEEL